jgi:hypothetical protein
MAVEPLAIWMILAGLGHGGTVGADNGHDALRGKPLGRECCRAGIASVVIGDQLDLLAEKAALGVKIRDEQLDHLLHLRALAGERARQRSHQADLDRVLGIGRCGEQTEGHQEKQKFLHNIPSFYRVDH